MYQLAQDSLKWDVMGLFSFSIDQRVNVVNAIMNQQDGEVLIDISDEPPTLEPQYYKEAKKVEPPKKEEQEVLHEAVSLLRQWHKGAPGGAGPFLLSTNTINFLDKYDKSVTI